ncbi:vinorine synthase-like [Cucurbita moschata]|uniref:Vinorine synthase-like n=1 Tax=Cucurbita moschata TaxID=3662 RepID=A0A6J1F534_CUCMO|nr:vinorine synthase-like [Cucurbita moschata]
MGVMFLVAKAGCPMTDVMNDKDSQREEKLKLLLLDDMNKKEQEVKPMLSIQLTQFECGGEVICVFFNHKLSDMYSVTHFMRDWASIARSFTHGDLPVVNPQFNGATCFPPELEVSDNPSGRQDTSGTNERVEVPLSFSKFCSKRLVFEGSKIAALKAMVSEKAENPTRVQLIAALIYKAVLSAKSSVTGCVEGATQLHLMINLRQRVESPLPRLIGNIISRYIASETTWEQRDKEVWDIVGGMKKSLKEFCQKFPRDYKNKEWGRLYKLHAKQSTERLRNNGDVAVISCSSWCRFPVYDVDFGWGKAVWVTVPEFPAKDLILLMDTKDGEGIEAMVSLEEKAMEAFQQNQEFFSFCELKK